MVNIHVEAMVIAETLEEATVIQEEVVMKATTCRTMMGTSQGGIMALLVDHKEMTSIMITAMLLAILVAQVTWVDVLMAKEIMMMNSTIQDTNQTTEAEDASIMNSEAIEVDTIEAITTIKETMIEEGEYFSLSHLTKF